MRHEYPSPPRHPRITAAPACTWLPPHHDHPLRSGKHDHPCQEVRPNLLPVQRIDMPVKAALPPRTPRRRITPNLDAHRLGPRAANVRACRIFVSAGPGRDALKVMPEFPVLYSTGGQVGTVAYTRCVRRTGPVLCRPGSDVDRTHLDGRHEANVLPVPHEGTCQGVPPLRREPYAGLRRVSHEQCPERS